mmetsp:Transcript_2676/g.7023  ORF Transcript_2676/g.7023 Transcript_2676/m.7023 type:complete len:206 (-) Transcript_2676:47-664(-)
MPRAERGWRVRERRVGGGQHALDEVRPARLHGDSRHKRARERVDQPDAVLVRHLAAQVDDCARPVADRIERDERECHIRGDLGVHVVADPLARHLAELGLALGRDHEVALLLAHPIDDELVHRRLARHVCIEPLAVRELGQEPPAARIARGILERCITERARPVQRACDAHPRRHRAPAAARRAPCHRRAARFLLLCEECCRARR